MSTGTHSATALPEDRSAPRRLHLVLIPAAALLAIVPLLINGPSCGHDIAFHLLNWLEARTQLAHAVWPRWAYTPAYNAGEPRFVFYPPLSWLMGALLSALMPFRFVPIAYTWVCLTLSGFAMHRFALRHAAPGAALVASVVYVWNPYMLFTAYERTAYAELLAAAIMPLLFAAILPSRPLQSRPLESRRSQIVAVAIAVALLWMTNAPAAVMGCYALALLTVVRLLSSPRPERPAVAQVSACGTVLGLALSAFYLVPAAWDRRFVQVDMALVSGLAPGDNFLFHRMADPAHNDVVRAVSLVACGLLASTMLLLLWCWLRSEGSAQRSRNKLPLDETTRENVSRKPLLAALTVLTFTICFLLFPASAWMWAHVPELVFLQFPWRLLLLLATAASVLLGLVLGALKPARAVLLASVAAPILIVPTWSNFGQHCAPEDTPDRRAALFHSAFGSDPTDEYTPVGADNDVLHPKSPPFWIVPVPAHPGDAAVETPPPSGTAPGAASAAAPGPLSPHTSVHLDEPAYIILNRRQVPLWQIRVNGAIAKPAGPERDDGLITLALPPGEDTIDLTLARTPQDNAGLALSLAALLVLLWMADPEHGPHALLRRALSASNSPIHSSGDENLS